MQVTAASKITQIPPSKTTQVGKRAVSSCSWLTAPVEQVQKKKKRSNVNNVIVNPIFEECNKICCDPYWIEIFKSAAYGKFPPKFSCVDGELFYKKGRQVQSMVIPEQPEEALVRCLVFFRHCAGMYSEMDRETMKRQEYERSLNQRNQKQTWSTIKKKKMKKFLIEFYIQEVSKREGLTKEQEEQLREVINLGIIFGYFNNRTIIFKDNRIDKIEGIFFNNNTGLFEVEESVTKIKPKKSKKENKLAEDKNSVDYLKHWNIYLNRTFRKITNAGRRSKTTRTNGTLDTDATETNDETIDTRNTEDVETEDTDRRESDDENSIETKRKRVNTRNREAGSANTKIKKNKEINKSQTKRRTTKKEATTQKEGIKKVISQRQKTTKPKREVVTRTQEEIERIKRLR
jgi:hypothetical protein